MIPKNSNIEVLYRLVPGQCASPISPKVNLQTQIFPLSQVKMRSWLDIIKLQGLIGAVYLFLKYGSKKTFILLAYANKDLTHIEWIIPSQKIKKRYGFISEDTYSIISCLTDPTFRGNKIYPSQIQQVVMSEIPAKEFLIWAGRKNMPSIKGIETSGAKKTGFFIQKKFLLGFISIIRSRIKE